ncbi:HNH endonuclease [Companilactobacillus jidongensis]|uniref:HNH endonuclease n=1 Tax=Companilactobacillus jidongensis TaxID=2486006 RepID=UPI000F76B05E|nr:HNH endonuclease [Companilactobacillus jidongensis]
MFVRRCKHGGCHNLVSGTELFCNEHADELPAYQERMNKMHQHIASHTKDYNSNVRYKSKERSKRESFYHSGQWKKLRLFVLERDNYLCQYCLRFGLVRPAKIVDHVVPAQAAPELMTDISNLVTCCNTCHRAKTEWEQRFYHTGYQDEKQRIKADILIKNLSELPNFSK